MNYLKIGQKEVLFKAKTVNNEWVEGLPYYTTQHEETGANVVLQFQKIDEKGGVWFPGYKVKPETLCEFTGKYDDTHRRLFTGDIIYLRHQDSFDIGLVAFNNDFSCYEIQYPGTNYFRDSLEVVDCELVKVTKIGNIIDSPDFFKKDGGI